MNVEMNEVKTGTIQEFADEHGLTMKIIELELPIGNPARYCAQFDDGVINEETRLSNKIAFGATPQKAIDSYASVVSMKLLVIGANTPNHREIKCWRFITESEKASNDLIDAAVEFAGWIPSQLSDPDYNYSHEYGDDARRFLNAVEKYEARKENR